MDSKAPKYRGGEKKLKYLSWILKMEQTFRSVNFIEWQKVSYNVMMFEDKALQWWDVIDRTLNDVARDVITWVVFNKKVEECFCSEGIK